MKSYKNYYSSSDNKIKHDSTLFFDKQRTGIEGRVVRIDDIQENALVYDHTNPMDEYKEDRQIRTPMSSKIHRGSFVEMTDDDGKERKFIVVTKIDNHYVYKLAKMTECNWELKWQDKPYKATHTCYCVIAKQLGASTSDGIEESKVITQPNTLRSITLPDNTETRTIVKDLRFFIGEDVYKVTNVDTVLMSGAIQIVCVFDNYNSATDNKEKGIADYWGKDNYSIKIQGDNNGSISLKLNDTLQLNTVIMRDNSIVTGEEITWSSSDESICTISDMGLITSIKEGNCTISAKMKNNEDVKDTINISVVSASVVDTYTAVINGADKIVWGYGSKYTCYKYKNNTQVTGRFNFSIDDMGNSGIASLSVIDENNVTVKVASDVKFVRKQFKLVTVDKSDNSIKSEKVIGIKGLT